MAVEIAKRHNGEIINGDAIQLYAGLPIITNKITPEEQQGIPHHLLGCIGLHEQTWVVGTFVKKALEVVDEIRSRGKLPILVGGTHYYTQSLLFEDNFTDVHEQREEFVEDTAAVWPILKEPTPVILEELMKIDPKMANRWHPNDRRKIQRSLEVYLQTGKKASEVYDKQRKLGGMHNNDEVTEEEPAHLDEPKMRFPALLFWVHADTDMLKDRLDRRVDKMVEQGLIGEVETLNTFAQAQSEADHPVDESRGIWVSIGYKEFKPYAYGLSTPNTDEKPLEKLKAEALEKTKAATRQYAKRQVRWIRIKLINALAQANASSHLYVLHGSDVSAFEENVLNPALTLAGDFLSASNPLPEPTSLSRVAADMLKPKRDYDLAATPERWTRQICDSCGVTCVTEDQWSQHVNSKAHKKRLSKRRKADAGIRERSNDNIANDPDVSEENVPS